MTNSEIVTKYLNAFGKLDFTTCRSLVHDDFKFRGPIDQVDGADNFFELVKMLEQICTGIHLHGTAENGEWVGSYYDFQTKVPQIESTPTSEWFRVVEGKIKESYLIFDASNWRPLMAQMKG